MFLYVSKTVFCTDSYICEYCFMSFRYSSLRPTAAGVYGSYMTITAALPWRQTITVCYHSTSQNIVDTA